jgi:hypothetical protein
LPETRSIFRSSSTLWTMRLRRPRPASLGFAPLRSRCTECGAKNDLLNITNNSVGRITHLPKGLVRVPSHHSFLPWCSKSIQYPLGTAQGLLRLAEQLWSLLLQFSLLAILVNHWSYIAEVIFFTLVFWWFLCWLSDCGPEGLGEGALWLRWYSELFSGRRR